MAAGVEAGSAEVDATGATTGAAATTGFSTWTIGAGALVGRTVGDWAGVGVATEVEAVAGSAEFAVAVDFGWLKYQPSPPARMQPSKSTTSRRVFINGRIYPLT